MASLMSVNPSLPAGHRSAESRTEQFALPGKQVLAEAGRGSAAGAATCLLRSQAPGPVRRGARYLGRPGFSVMAALPALVTFQLKWAGSAAFSGSISFFL